MEGKGFAFFAFFGKARSLANGGNEGGITFTTTPATGNKVLGGGGGEVGNHFAGLTV